MASFKLTKKNLLMLKAMADSFDKINEIAFADEMHVMPYGDSEKLRDIKDVLTKFGEVYKT